MTDAQKKAVADYKALRNTDLTGPPWTVLLRVPDLVVPCVAAPSSQSAEQRASPKLTQSTVLIAARHLTNSFEFNAHHTLAVKAGLSADVISAIAEGRRPSTWPRTRRSSTISASSSSNKAVSDGTYARASPVR